MVNKGRHLNILVVLKQPMLHTKFQGHMSFGSGEEDFFKVFTIYGHVGHFGHVTWTIFGFNRPSGFRGEDVWKC